jgi:hypothetical protein
MARAFRFLKRTSLNCAGAGAGTGVTEADNGGVVLTGAALGDAPLTGAASGGVSSCAGRCEVRQIESSKTEKNLTRALIGMTCDNGDLCVVGQARRLLKLKNGKRGACPTIAASLRWNNPAYGDGVL